MTLLKLSQALLVLSKYNSREYQYYAQHDVFYIGDFVYKDISQEDLELVRSLGLHCDLENSLEDGELEERDIDDETTCYFFIYT